MLFRIPIVSSRLLELRQRPDLNFKYFEWVKDRHRNSISSLVCEVTANPGSQFLIGLPNVNWLTIVVKECVDTPFEVSNLHHSIGDGIKKVLIEKGG
ncbi:MAG: hypothetical protein Q7U80_04530 [Thiobacillus sp.]|nr:hypothetical protein [Thiobacillus sp.]MDP3125600.1 hypothetical protein [Thiobacillus sp.]